MVVKCCSVVQFCDGFFGTKTWSAERIKVCIIVINVWINRAISFRNNFLHFLYHGFNQQFFVCRTSFIDSNPEKCPKIAKLIDRYNQNDELVWLFLKNTPAFLINQLLQFFHQSFSRFFVTFRNIRECRFKLFPCNANLINGKFQSLHSSVVRPVNQIRFLSKQPAEILASRSLSTIL